MSRTTMDIFILLTVFQLMSSNEAFNFSCPSQAQWTLMSKSMCIPARYYTCLYDVTPQVNAYRHRCSRPRSLEAGYKYVFQPNLNRATCSITRYQPFIFETHGNSDCIFLKSVCNSEGQKTDEKGNVTFDRTCICNIDNGYTFVEDKGNQSTCNPSVEDCSCYAGMHPKNKSICSKDMKCSVEIELMPVNSQGDRLNISVPSSINFGYYKYNLYRENGYRTKAAVTVLIILVSLFICGACVFTKGIQQQWIQTPCKPSVPFTLSVVEWSDESITICCNCVKYRKIPAGFIIEYRQKDSKNWMSEKITVSRETIEYTLHGLLPDTLYKIKVKSRNGNIMRNNLTSVEQRTRETVNTFTERDKTKYNKLLQSSKTEKRYFVRIMIVGKGRAGKTCLLRKLLNDDISDVLSTDGVDILLRRCKINITNGKWTIGKDFTDDQMERIQRALGEVQEKENNDDDSKVHKPNHKQKNVKETNASDVKSLTENGSSQEKNVVSDGNKELEISKISHIDNDSSNTIASNNKPTDIHADPQGGIPYKEISLVKFEDNLKDLDNKSKAGIEDRSIIHRGESSTGKMENKKYIKSAENNVTVVNNSNRNEENVKSNPDIRGRDEDNDDNVKPSFLLIPKDLMSHMFSKTAPDSCISSNLYALCELWDFAGQKEFYATHQAFLSSSAVYLLVADMADDIDKQDIKKHFADFDDIGGYVEFWFDSIHCHRTTDLTSQEQNIIRFEPPIILVFTGKDKYNEKQFVKRKKALTKQIDNVFGHKSKFHHLQRTFYVSNTEDSNEQFETLRNAISATAQKMHNWGETLPLKWILLEYLIGMNKGAGKNFISLTDMSKMAKHHDIGIHDIEELLLFLRFQHEVGNIIFFHNVYDLIILNPQWLVDALRCLVSDRYDGELQHTSDWTEFVRNGKISKSLITKLFQSKPGSQFAGQSDNLCKVMEKLDILVNIEDMNCYIMPSKMPSSTFNELSDKIGIMDSNCKRTSWLCLKFAFLPPSFYNHFCAWFIRHYKPSKVKNESDRESLALFRGICMFDIDSSGCEKILVTMSTDTIALQILSFSKMKKEIGSMCSIFRRELLIKVKEITHRYNLKVIDKMHFKCSNGNYYQNTVPYEVLKIGPEYYCEEHREVHRSESIYLPWMSKEYEVSKDVINYLRIVVLLFIAEDAVRIVFDDQFLPSVLCKWLRRHYVQLKSLRHRQHILSHHWDVLHSCMKNTREQNLSKRFDLLLMICLLKKFTKLKITGTRIHPRIESTTLSDTLSTIWYYRAQVDNYVNGTIPQTNFQRHWMMISQAIKRLSEGSSNLLELKCFRLEKCRLDDKNEITAEEYNYIRIVYLITHVATKVMRNCFDAVFLPDSLKTTLTQGRKKIHNYEKWIGYQQFALLYPQEGQVSSELFDIRTMAILMKCLKDMKLEYTLWKIGSNLEYCEDLSRLWWYRREIIYQRKFTMDQFNDRWVDICGAVVRLGGNSYIDLCNQLKIIPLYA